MRAALVRLGLAAATVGAASPLAAQRDTAKTPPEGVRVVLNYTPGSRPGLIVVPGAGLDSARAILRRDLDFSDRFEIVVLPTNSAGSGSGGGSSSLNYGLYRSFGASYAVELVPMATATIVKLHDLAAGKVLNQQSVTVPAEGSADFRMQVHRISDEVVRWVTGVRGIAATRVAFVSAGRIYRIDSDGFGTTPLTPAGQTALSPSWSPDGQRIAYTRLGEGKGTVQLLSLGSGTFATVEGTQSALNITPSFSPDGRTLAYAHSDENGTTIVAVNVAENCCPQRLTVGRFADNLSPTYSPDGRRIAFVSTRAGPPQIYAMAPDGTDQDLLVPFDFGATGSSNAPDWSPDGASIVFHREVSGSPQIFLMDIAARRLKQLTSSGRSEDPTWAPDGRHVAFVSDRSGVRQLWIIDTETSRVRQLSVPGAARLPAWSRRLGAAVGTNP